MAAEIVFSGGERVLVPSANADEVMAKMVTEGSRDHQATGGARVRPGFIDFESDQGTVYIRPDQVAYVCDEAEMPEVEETRGRLRMPRGRIARG